MRLNRDELLSLWNSKICPCATQACNWLEAFLVSCGEAVDRFGEEGPEDRLSVDPVAHQRLKYRALQQGVV